MAVVIRDSDFRIVSTSRNLRGILMNPRTFKTYAEMIEAAEGKTYYRDGSLASHMGFFAPHQWTCEQCGKVSVFPERNANGSSGYGITRNPERMICYECCHANNIAELRDRSKPFTAYISQDGRSVSNWPGGILGTITQSTVSRTGWRGTRLTHVRVRDVHGAYWHGKGAGSGMCITLRPMKGAHHV